VISHTTQRFRDAYQQLPARIQRKADDVYLRWSKDPWNPVFHFKQIHAEQAIYSVRISIGWRAVGIREDDTIIWFWIGSHADYDKLIRQF